MISVWSLNFQTNAFAFFPNFHYHYYYQNHVNRISVLKGSVLKVAHHLGEVDWYEVLLRIFSGSLIYNIFLGISLFPNHVEVIYVSLHFVFADCVDIAKVMKSLYRWHS